MTDDRHRDRTAEDPTIAQPAPGTLVGRPAATDPTIAASVAPRPTSHAAARPRAASTGGASTGSKVGDDLRAATIERFSTMPSDRFELLDELARGGLGRVFRARDPRTNRIVALKEVLSPHPETIARFAREAMVTANLQHPAIVPVYEVGRWQNGDPYYAMKLVRGRTLDEVIRETTTTAGRVALVPHAIAVADALAYAHSESVIHRDLKPANVLVGAYGETVVIDWGLAKNLATGEELDALPFATTIPPNAGETLAGSVLGTPAYMPPEQAHGEPLDEHADVYAIGAILYHMLTGARPFAQAAALDELVELVRTVPPRPITELAPDLPGELVAIVHKAMARAPGERYATAAGLAQDLRSFQAGKLVAAHTYTARQLVRRWIARHRSLVITAAVAVAALTVLGAASVSRIAAERDEATAQRANAQAERAEALAATELAERRFADSLENLARQALLAGAPDRALTLLAADAAARPVPTVPLQILAAEARTAYAGLVAIVPPLGNGTTTAELTRAGDRVYMVSTSGDVRAWDLAAQRALWTATGQKLVALSPDDRWLVGVDIRGVLNVRAADTGAVVASWPASSPDPQDLPSAFRWSPDGARFVGLAPSGRTVLGARDAPPRELERHAGMAGAVIASIAFSPGGRLLATAGADGALLIRDGTTGATLAKLVDGVTPSALDGFAWLDDDRIASGDQQGTIRIWRVSAQRVEVRLKQPGEVYGIITPGGASAPWFAAYGSTPIVTTYDGATGAVLAQLAGHVSGCDYAVSDGARLITTDEIGELFAWDAATGERLAALPPERAGMAVAARGDRVVAYSIARARVFRFSRDGTLRHVDGHRARIRDVEFGPDGTLWTASNDGSARGYDFATGQARVLGAPSYSEADAYEPVGRPFASPHGLRSLTVSPDGQLVVTASEAGSIDVWDAHTGALRTTWTGHTGRVRRVVFARDGRTAYSVGDTTLRAWEVASGRELGHATLDAPGWDVALVDGERTIATESQANHVMLWHRADLTPFPIDPWIGVLRDVLVADDHVVIGAASQLARLDASGAITERAVENRIIAAAATGRWIAAGAANWEIALFTADTVAPVRSWSSPDPIVALAFRPDGAVLAVVNNHRVRLWDPATGSLLAESPAVPVSLTTLAWSADGQRLAFAGTGGTAWVWELAHPDLAALPAFARCVSPWTLDDAALRQATFDPASCAGVLPVR